jgi:hypothetical protein
MVSIASRWVVILKCASCQKLFTINRIAVSDVSLLPNIASCPHCSHLPRREGILRLPHLISSIKKEKD